MLWQQYQGPLGLKLYLNQKSVWFLVTLGIKSCHGVLVMNSSVF